MELKECVDSVRVRLGCAGPCEPVPCAACQNGSLDTGAAHATFPSRALLWPRLTARSLPVATPASSASANGPVESRRGPAAAATVVRMASQRRPPSGPTEARQRRRAPPSGQCGVRFSLKPSCPTPCGLDVLTPRPMTMSTTRATPCCSCLPTPSLAARWSSFAQDIFNIAQQDRPLPQPEHLAHDPGRDLWP